ncbi:electron transport complex subunit RsxG [Marinobacter sp. R17]|uniref:electron transport complex subunit RsxG n=1 Tax=Marinobacter sp. R17 TaxID=2484250 RepID=UPI000F4CECAC|nr:electron transport complex subunit RsxG [Marinobacter sp. R17]ROT98328.1 electron transport complex subunit RsxG [Marinobacter sp. R17]
MAALGQSITRNAIGLALFAVITAGTIAVTHAFTSDRIQDQIREAEAGALLQIIPEDQHTNDLLAATQPVGPDEQLGLSETLSVHIARKNGKVTGVILPAVTHNGYSGDIHLLVGIGADGRILGVRVTQHHETPGLGDKVETKKTSWVYSFNGKSLENTSRSEWAVAKDGGQFDQFTGATITPRAVVDAVHNALLYFQAHRDTLLAPTAGMSATHGDQG